MIYHNRKMKEENKIKIIKVNALKRAARMNQRGKLFAELCEATAKLPNDIMASKDPSTLLLQVLIYLSTNIIKYSYNILGGNMGQLSDQNKRTIAAAIVRKWGERIWLMVGDVWLL